MRKRLAAIAFVVVAGSVGAGVAAYARASDVQPQASCSLPPEAVSCLDDSPCAPYLATCDVQQGQCVCPAAADLGMDLGPSPGADLTPTPTGTDGGSSVGTPPAGGGMTSPPKSAGCSFVPGSR